MIKYCPFSENEMFFRFSNLNESLYTRFKKESSVMILEGIYIKKKIS